MIDQPTIDRILDAANIVDVVSEFVTLRKRGINYVGLCPFHTDKTPSFYVSPAKNICKCFACGEGGTAVHFIMKHEQLNYFDALRYLAIDDQHTFAVAFPLLLLVGQFPFLYLDVIFLGQITQGIEIVQLFMLHNEVNGRTTFANPLY